MDEKIGLKPMMKIPEHNPGDKDARASSGGDRRLQAVLPLLLQDLIGEQSRGNLISAGVHCLL